MNRGIELTRIHSDVEDAWYQSMRRAQEAASEPQGGSNLDVFEEDDLERPLNQDEEPDADNEDDGGPVPPQTVPSIPEPEGLYSPVTVFENDIREMYPRRHRQGRTGTRIVYRSGAPRIVKESYEEVKAKFAALGEAND